MLLLFIFSSMNEWMRSSVLFNRIQRQVFPVNAAAGWLFLKTLIAYLRKHWFRVLWIQEKSISMRVICDRFHKSLRSNDRTFPQIETSSVPLKFNFVKYMSRFGTTMQYASTILIRRIDTKTLTSLFCVMCVSTETLNYRAFNLPLFIYTNKIHYIATLPSQYTISFKQ